MPSSMPFWWNRGHPPRSALRWVPERDGRTVTAADVFEVTRGVGLGRNLLRSTSTRARDKSPATSKVSNKANDSDSEASAYRFVSKRQLHRPVTSRYWVVVWKSAPIASGTSNPAWRYRMGLSLLKVLQRRRQIAETYARFAVDDVSVSGKLISLSHLDHILHADGGA